MNRAVTSPSMTRLVSCAGGQSLDEREPRAGRWRHQSQEPPRSSPRDAHHSGRHPRPLPLPARAAPLPPSAGTYLWLFTRGMTNLPGVCLSRPSRQRCVPISAADRPARWVTANWRHHKSVCFAFPSPPPSPRWHEGREPQTHPLPAGAGGSSGERGSGGAGPGRAGPPPGAGLGLSPPACPSGTAQLRAPLSCARLS